MDKDIAREYLEDFVGCTLPIKDKIIYSEIVDNQIIHYTFRGLLKIAYDLQDNNLDNSN